MKIKLLILIAVLALVTLGLSACTRSATTPPPPAATLDMGQPPLPGQDTINQNQFLTMTAVAVDANGNGTGTAQETPVPPPVIIIETQPAPETVVTVEAPAPPVVSEPVEAPPVVAPAPTPGIPTSYTLQQGEHPYCIARRLNVNPGELLSLNGLSTRSVTYPGLSLRIPQTGNTFPGSRSLRTHPANYTVRGNDTIFSIACNFGDVDPYVIATVNNLEAPYTLTSGQTLQIP